MTFAAFVLGTTLLTTPYGFTYIKRRSSTSQRTCVIPCERAAQSWSDRMACSSFCKGYRLPLTTSCNHTILQILRYSNDCNQAYQLQETCETEGWLRPYSQLAEQKQASSSFNIKPRNLSESEQRMRNKHPVRLLDVSELAGH